MESDRQGVALDVVIFFPDVDALFHQLDVPLGLQLLIVLGTVKNHPFTVVRKRAIGISIIRLCFL